MCIRNKSGPNMEPEGTPAVMSAKEEACPSSTIFCFLFHTTLANFKRLSDMAFWFNENIQIKSSVDSHNFTSTFSWLADIYVMLPQEYKQQLEWKMRYCMFQNCRNINLPMALPLDATGGGQITWPDATTLSSWYSLDAQLSILGMFLKI